jgi:hypothetical protein
MHFFVAKTKYDVVVVCIFCLLNIYFCGEYYFGILFSFWTITDQFIEFRKHIFIFGYKIKTKLYLKKNMAFRNSELSRCCSSPEDESSVLFETSCLYNQ